MSAGIAVEFKRRFGMQKDLIASSRGVGTCCLLKKKHINIFYLVTKEFSSRSKPTLSSLSDSLEDMVLIAKHHEIKVIACPKIGCGLDNLEWKDVKLLLSELAEQHDLRFIVYYL
jgi:hypothetical protein